MDLPAALNSPQYALTSLSTSSVSIAVEEIYKNKSRIIIDNTMGTTPVFVVSAAGAVTAVFPASASVASIGAVVGPGTVQTYYKDPEHTVISAIRSTGSGDLYIKIAQGD